MRNLGEGWRISRHGDERRVSMGLTSDVVRTALLEPIEEYDGARHHPQGRRVRRGPDGVCVVYAPKDRVVLTLLWDGSLGRDRSGSALS